MGFHSQIIRDGRGEIVQGVSGIPSGERVAFLGGNRWNGGRGTIRHGLGEIIARTGESHRMRLHLRGLPRRGQGHVGGDRSVERVCLAIQQPSVEIVTVQSRVNRLDDLIAICDGLHRIPVVTGSGVEIHFVSVYRPLGCDYRIIIDRLCEIVWDSILVPAFETVAGLGRIVVGWCDSFPILDGLGFDSGSSISVEDYRMSVLRMELIGDGHFPVTAGQRVGQSIVLGEVPPVRNMADGHVLGSHRYGEFTTGDRVEAVEVVSVRQFCGDVLQFGSGILVLRMFERVDDFDFPVGTGHRVGHVIVGRFGIPTVGHAGNPHGSMLANGVGAGLHRLEVLNHAVVGRG